MVMKLVIMVLPMAYPARRRMAAVVRIVPKGVFSKRCEGRIVGMGGLISEKVVKTAMPFPEMDVPVLVSRSHGAVIV